MLSMCTRRGEISLILSSADVGSVRLVRVLNLPQFLLLMSELSILLSQLLVLLLQLQVVLVQLSQHRTFSLQGKKQERG